MNLIKVILLNLVMVITVVFTMVTFFEDYVDESEILKIIISAWIILSLYSLPILALMLIAML